MTYEENMRRIEEMKKQTIGVEVEMANITRRSAIQIVAEHYGTEDTINHKGGTYDAWTCLDNQGRTWSMVTDSSIRAPRSHQSEMTTPILHYDDIEDLQEIIRELRKAGGKSSPKYGCGVHIHVGANGHTPKSLRNLANLMASHEELLINSINISRERTGRWCKVVDKDFLNMLNKEKPATMEQFANVWYVGNGASCGRNQHYNESRYHMLNYHATFTKGTVEFRCFQFDNPTEDKKGGLHAGQLKTYIQFVLALSQLAKELSYANPKPRNIPNQKEAMRGWLIQLGLIGEEFKTCRTILMNRLSTGTAA